MTARPHPPPRPPKIRIEITFIDPQTSPARFNVRDWQEARTYLNSGDFRRLADLVDHVTLRAQRR